MSDQSSGGQASGSSGGQASGSASGASNGLHLQSAFELKEYETQFFGFTPKSFSDGLYNAIMAYMSDYLGPTINAVKAKCGLNLSEDEIREIQDNIQQAVEPSIDKAFDKMEVFLMENVLNIPPHVLLKEDKIHDLHSVSHADIVRIEQEIKDLQSQIKAKKYVNECLRQELDESAPVLADLDELMQSQKVALNALQKVTQDGTGFEDLLKSTALQLHKLDEQLEKAAKDEPFEKRPRVTDEPMRE